jgi:hypothetical protein
MIFFKWNWRVEKHTSHFVALKECLLTFWLNGLPKAKHVKYRSSIGVSSMVGRDKVYVEEFHDRNASTSSGWYFANLRYDEGWLSH